MLKKVGCCPNQRFSTGVLSSIYALFDVYLSSEDVDYRSNKMKQQYTNANVR